MSGKIEQVLNTDERGCYEASLIVPDGSGIKYVPCVVTGKFTFILFYNIIKNIITLANRLPSIRSKNGI